MLIDATYGRRTRAVVVTDSGHHSFCSTTGNCCQSFDSMTTKTKNRWWLLMGNEVKPQGVLLVVSGPSGAGKGTICGMLREQMPDLGYSVSVTTRQPRTGEVDGVNYFFKTVDEVKEMIANDEFLEYAEVYGNYYGTPRKFVMDQLNEGRDVLLEIDIQGALQVKEHFPDGVFVFILRLLWTSCASHLQTWY